MPHTRTVDLVCTAIDQHGAHPLEAALDDMETRINALMDADPDWQATRVSVFQFNDGQGGHDYLLCTMVLDKH